MKRPGDELLREAMQDARAGSMKAARLEPAELVWWRAQLRKRQAAMERVSGPIRGVQTFTAALVLGVAVVVAAAGWAAWGEWLKPMEMLVSAPVPGAGLVAGLVAVAMVVVLAGVVVYVAVERE